MLKRVRSWWLPLALLYLWAINVTLWSPYFTYLKGARTSGQIFHSITITATLMLFLLTGDFLSQLNFSLARAIKQWITLWGLALTIVLANWLIFNHFQVQSLYNALMPIARNTAPLATAFIIASLLLPWLSKYFAPAANAWLLVLLFPLLVTSIFGRDSFGLKNGQSVTFYLLTLTIGALCQSIRLNRHQQIIGVIIWTTTSLLLVSLMPLISLQIHGSLITAGRFTTPVCLPLVLVAFNLYLLIRPLLHSVIKMAKSATFSGLFLTVIFNNSVAIKILNHIIGRGNALVLQLTIILLLTLIIAGIAAIFPVVINWLQGLFNLNARINRLTKITPGQPVAQQITSISQRLWNSLKHRWPTFFALFSFYILANLSIYFMSRRTIFVKQSMLWLTMILFFLIFKALQALFNRYWVAFLTTGLLMVIWIVANIQKMELRDEPILPSELSMVNDLGSLLGMIDYHLLIYAGIAIAIVVIVTIILEHSYNVQHLNSRWRIFWLVLAIGTFASSTLWNHHNSRLQTLMTGFDDQPHFIHQAVGARQNGPTIQFLNNVDITVMVKPHGYSAAEMTRISHKYQQVATQINQTRTNELKKQTVIFNLSESFANPNRVPGVSLKHNPIPQIDKIKQQTTSGIMVSSGYGGGTADMEYMTLTGFAMCNFAQTLSTPYTQLVPYLKYNPTIVQSFKYAVAIHPYSKKFYDRGTDYPKFGFNYFSYLGNQQHPIRHQKKLGHNTYLADQTAYANVLDQLASHHGPQFINLVTMQNHLPYNNLYSHLNKFKATVKDGTDPQQVENYAMGIHYTDQAVASFIKKINHINRPITIVFYGDHLPGIYRNSMKKDGLKLHETDYFIYSNPAAQQLGAKRLTMDTKYVGPNDFIAMVAEQTNSRVTPYQALLTQLYHQLPAYALSTQQNGTNSFNSAPEYINQSGKVVAYQTLSPKQKQLWHDYQLVQYDITAGHHYLLKTGMMK